jgi:hypothetical protein
MAAYLKLLDLLSSLQKDQCEQFWFSANLILSAPSPDE